MIVHNYRVPPGESIRVSCEKVLSAIEKDNGAIAVYVQKDTKNEENNKPHMITVIGTGWDTNKIALPADMEFVATVQTGSKLFVWHVYAMQLENTQPTGEINP